MQTSELAANELEAGGELRLYRVLRHFWQPVMYSADLGDRPEKVVLLDEQLVIVRLGGEVRLMGRDYNLVDPEAGDRVMLEFNDLVIEQDRPVVESQRPEHLPFDVTAELHIRGPDKVSLEYRRWLVELSRELDVSGSA